MVDWIKNNVALIILAASLIGTIAVAQYRLNLLEEGAKSSSDHRHDTIRHLDPIRDPAIHKDLIDRLERLEMKLDRLETRIDRLNRLREIDNGNGGGHRMVDGRRTN